MLRILANNHYAAFAANDFALFTNRLYRRSNFHNRKKLHFSGNFLMHSVSVFAGRPKEFYAFYFERHVMRPRVKSYGDICTVTLSPGRIRMKFMRNFPEMVAKILCPFPMSTWNIALGSASMTVPSSSITSSLAKQITSLCLFLRLCIV